jgi:hypothetical protein
MLVMVRVVGVWVVGVWVVGVWVVGVWVVAVWVVAVWEVVAMGYSEGVAGGVVMAVEAAASSRDRTNEVSDSTALLVLDLRRGRSALAVADALD